MPVRSPTQGVLDENSGVPTNRPGVRRKVGIKADTAQRMRSFLRVGHYSFHFLFRFVIHRLDDVTLQLQDYLNVRRGERILEGRLKVTAGDACQKKCRDWPKAGFG